MAVRLTCASFPSIRDLYGLREIRRRIASISGRGEVTLSQTTRSFGGTPFTPVPGFVRSSIGEVLRALDIFQRPDFSFNTICKNLGSPRLEDTSLFALNRQRGQASNDHLRRIEPARCKGIGFASSKVSAFNCSSDFYNTVKLKTSETRPQNVARVSGGISFSTSLNEIRAVLLTQSDPILGSTFNDIHRLRDLSYHEEIGPRSIASRSLLPEIGQSPPDDEVVSDIGVKPGIESSLSIAQERSDLLSGSQSLTLASDSQKSSETSSHALRRLVVEAVDSARLLRASVSSRMTSILTISSHVAAFSAIETSFGVKRSSGQVSDENPRFPVLRPSAIAFTPQRVSLMASVSEPMPLGIRPTDWSV
ncbi:hypothetical protein BD310DRAFT_903354 [Dichomitus squalens]|uniref:Uncharacterized protein n=1 Tax=Dichomitus squalens TaxID=114155 RepID=A0A4Q9Q882_9APHY|nr:hypothetical protein BD310DRAFT_903354 [Dichomitus squalens]